MPDEGPSSEIAKIRSPDQLPIDPNADEEQRKYYAAQTRGLEQDIEERKKYSQRIFVLCCIWVFVVFALLVAQGLSWLTHFSLSQPVLLAAIGSTTANIIAVFVIVARYLFPDRSRR